MKLLPRHYFGLVQSHLFPKAFLYGIGLTTAALGTFARQNPVSSWKSIEKFQVFFKILKFRGLGGNDKARKRELEQLRSRSRAKRGLGELRRCFLGFLCRCVNDHTSPSRPQSCSV